MRVAAQHLSRPGAVLCSRRTDAVLRGPPLPAKALRKALRKANSFRSSKGVLVSSQGRVKVGLEGGGGGGGGEKKEKAKKESFASSSSEKRKEEEGEEEAKMLSRRHRPKRQSHNSSSLDCVYARFKKKEAEEADARKKGSARDAAEADDADAEEMTRQSHTWRDVANEYLPEDVAKAISIEDPKRFERLIESLDSVASLEKLSTRPSSPEEEEEEEGKNAASLVFDITSLLRSHLVSKPFRATKDVRVIVTLVNHCFAVALADNDMRIDLKTRTKWANLAKTTLSVFEDQLDEVLEIDWKLIMDKVNHVSQGEVNEYYGPVVLAEWRSTISALGRASRRYFKLGSSEEIWEASRKNLENIWSEECFTSLAFMVAFLPTRHLRN